MNQSFTILVVALAIFTFASGSAVAAPAAKDDSRLAELRERFKERHPQIQALKRDGVVGETAEGYLDFVQKQSEEAADLVAAENKDRKALYNILAEEEKVAVEVVAIRSAKRNFERAKPGEFLKEGGKWKKKASKSDRELAR